MDLGLDHPKCAADLPCRLFRGIGGESEAAGGQGDTIGFQQRLGLILMEIHRQVLPLGGKAACRHFA